MAEDGGSATAEEAPPAGDVLGLVTRTSGWGQVRLYAASVDRVRAAERRHDHADLLRPRTGGAGSDRPHDRRRRGRGLRVRGGAADCGGADRALPYDFLAVWVVGMVVVAAFRKHWRLVLSLLAAIPVAAGATFVLNDLLGLEGDARALALGAPQPGVPVQLVVSLTLATVAARELSRPFRTTTHRLAVLAVLGAVLLPVAPPYRILCAVLVAGLTAGLVRLAFGTPRTTVSPADVQLGLRDLGVDTAPVEQWPAGTDDAVGVDGSRLRVRTMGRDEYDTQLTVTLWRFLWYRNSGSSVRLSPRHELERQALLLLLAKEHDVSVTPVVAIGMSDMGDAILATRVVGDELSNVEAERVDDALLDRVWAELGNLHAAAIAHGTLDSSAIRIDGDGTVQLGSFVRAEPVTRMDQVHADRAQVLVTTALTVGPERAISAALRAIEHEPDAATALVANLQAAAFDDQLRRSVAEEKLSIKDLRAATAAAAGIDVPELQKVRRVDIKALIKLGVLVAVAYTLISQLADIGFDTIADAIRAASLPILLAALVLGQIPRVAQAGSLQTASPAPVPLLRVTKAHVRHLLHQPGGAVERGPGRDEHPVLPALRGHRDGRRLRRSDRLLLRFRRPDQPPARVPPARARHPRLRR